MGGAASRVRGNDYDFPRLVDFDPGDMHTCRSDGFDRPGHVLLPECGGRAGHRSYRELCLSAMIEAIEVPLGPVPRLLAVRVPPDPVGPARPVPGVQRANRAPAVITQPAGWWVGPRGGCIGQALS